MKRTFPDEEIKIPWLVLLLWKTAEAKSFGADSRVLYTSVMAISFKMQFEGVFQMQTNQQHTLMRCQGQNTPGSTGNA